MAQRSLSVSRVSADALATLGNQIKLGRRNRRWTLSDLAARLGVDRRTVANIENGSPTTSIGLVFDAATLVGVNLFGLDGAELARARRAGEETLALMPERVRRPRTDDDGDFAF